MWPFRRKPREWYFTGNESWEVLHEGVEGWCLEGLFYEEVNLLTGTLRYKTPVTHVKGGQQTRVRQYLKATGS